MKLFTITFSVVFILGLAACSTPPTEKMKEAEDAVIMAESDPDAVAFAGNTLIRARDALTRMQGEADAKRYDTARNFADEAITLADRAIAEGKNATNRAMDEAASLINNLADLISETSNALKAASGVPNLQLDLNPLFNDLNLAQGIYEEALRSFQSENYSDISGKVQTARALLANINNSLSRATQATSRKR